MITLTLEDLIAVGYIAVVVFFVLLVLWAVAGRGGVSVCRAVDYRTRCQNSSVTLCERRLCRYHCDHMCRSECESKHQNIMLMMQRDNKVS